MQRRHSENAFAAAPFEIEPLKHHRTRFGDEHAAHDEKYDLLPDDHRDRAKSGAERKRAHVAHEDVRRVGVEPEEPKARADQGTAEHGELRRSRNVWKEQI